LLLFLAGLVAMGVAAPLAFASTAWADDAGDPRAAADALFAQAEQEDAAGDYGHAAAHYREAVARFPGFRYAPKAMTRAASIEAHREGNWIPFAQLEAVRRDPKVADDAGAIDALAKAIDAFPPGPTRSEAWMVCADAYVSRLHRRSDGEAALRKVVDDPLADGLVRRQAAQELVEAMIADGDLAAARTTARSLGHTLDARVAHKVDVLIRRSRMHFLAMVDLGLFVLLAAVAIARATARGGLGDAALAVRKLGPVGIVFAAYVALAGGALASEYETGNAEPFLVFGVVLLPIVMAARAWGAVGSAATAARVARAVVCATAVMAAAFLVLEAINGQYLEGFKL
jgi:hypothetical protein